MNAIKGGVRERLARDADDCCPSPRRTYDSSCMKSMCKSVGAYMPGLPSYCPVTPHVIEPRDITTDPLNGNGGAEYRTPGFDHLSTLPYRSHSRVP